MSDPYAALGAFPDLDETNPWETSSNRTKWHQDFNTIVQADSTLSANIKNAFAAVQESLHFTGEAWSANHAAAQKQLEDTQKEIEKHEAVIAALSLRASSTTARKTYHRPSASDKFDGTLTKYQPWLQKLLLNFKDFPTLFDTDHTKISEAYQCTTGEAEKTIQLTISATGEFIHQTWEDFQKFLDTRYSKPYEQDEALQKLRELKQKNKDLHTYAIEFQQLATLGKLADDKTKKSFFLGGLSEEMRQFRATVTNDDMFDTVLHKAYTYWESVKPLHQGGGRRPPANSPAYNSVSQGTYTGEPMHLDAIALDQLPEPGTVPPHLERTPLRQMTDQQKAERKTWRSQNNRCYGCGRPIHPGLCHYKSQQSAPRGGFSQRGGFDGRGRDGYFQNGRGRGQFGRFPQSNYNQANFAAFHPTPISNMQFGAMASGQAQAPYPSQLTLPTPPTTAQSPSPAVYSPTPATPWAPTPTSNPTSRPDSTHPHFQ